MGKLAKHPTLLQLAPVLLLIGGVCAGIIWHNAPPSAVVPSAVVPSAVVPSCPAKRASKPAKRRRGH